jgi:hypothetical protein
MDLQAINEIICKWKINQTLLAQKMGQPKTTFVKSLKGQQYYKFTPEQIKALNDILVELRTDLSKIIN